MGGAGDPFKGVRAHGIARTVLCVHCYCVSLWLPLAPGRAPPHLIRLPLILEHA